MFEGLSAVFLLLYVVGIVWLTAAAYGVNRRTWADPDAATPSRRRVMLAALLTGISFTAWIASSGAPMSIWIWLGVFVGMTLGALISGAIMMRAARWGAELRRSVREEFGRHT